MLRPMNQANITEENRDNICFYLTINIHGKIDNKNSLPVNCPNIACGRGDSLMEVPGK